MGNVASSHRQSPEVGVAHSTIELAADHKWNFVPLQQADTSAVERDHLSAGAELKDVGPLQEEGPLLREEQREPGEVRPPRVDFRFGEVGVDGQRGEQIRANPLGDIEAELAVLIGRCLDLRLSHLSDNGRANTQAHAEVENRDVGEKPCEVRLVDAIVATGAGPATGFLQSLHASLDVETPLPQAGVEGKALERKPDLRGPTP